MMTLTMGMAPPIEADAKMEVTKEVFERQVLEVVPVVRAMLAGALGVGVSHPDVDDGTAEVLRRAWEGRSRLAEGAPLRPWVMGIARHVAVDTIRARSRHWKRFGGGGREQEDGLEDVARVADDLPGQDELLHEVEMRRRVREAMEGLAPGPREAMLLVHVEGLGYQQVADRMGVPLGTVATWISRGRRAVKAAMKGWK